MTTTDPAHARRAGNPKPRRRRMQEFLQPFHTLRNRLIATSLVVVALPIAGVAIALVYQERGAVLVEKEKKLYAITRILDSELGPGFDAYLAGVPGGWNNREAAIRRLSERLTPLTDRVAAAEPGIGVGYYVRQLDAIVTYGPSRDYAYTIGRSIPADHPGRAVMALNEPRVTEGSLVRGSILNAMLPIERNGRVIGYVWANETTEAIGLQQRLTYLAAVATALFGFGVAFVLVWLMSHRLAREVDVVVDGLEAMETDLRYRIPPLRDELGVVVDAINGMAKALLDARSLTENILSSVADGIVAVDHRGIVTAINPAAQKLYEVTAEQALGRPYRDLFTSNRPHSALLDTLDSGRTHVGVAVELTRGEHTFKVDASASVLRDGDGRPIGAVVVLKDVSERDRLMVQVMRADRLAALGELTAGIAHEIRNPLTSIRGFLQYLQDCEAIEEWRHYGPLIIREVDSLNHIVGELLAFGRPRPPQIDSIDIGELVRETAFLARGRSEAQVTVTLEPGLPGIEGDREALKQAILNLLINAIQALPQGGHVEIAVAAVDAGLVSIAVHDDGVGIAPENLAKVFDPFFSTKASGTGLGLAMVHRIVDAHAGTISIDSRIGEGSTVEIRLPIRCRRPDQPSETAT
ncbi:two-component system sensor histidine kinase AtoS [Rubrivivax gelatinosus]|nr:two-component system sensor histidine kinase AtoS [Rubrivivax gelatinosus]